MGDLSELLEAGRRPDAAGMALDPTVSAARKRYSQLMETLAPVRIGPRGGEYKLPCPVSPEEALHLRLTASQELWAVESDYNRRASTPGTPGED